MSNRYTRKMKHKSNMKRQLSALFGYSSWNMLKKHYCEAHGNESPKYWCHLNISQRRKFAKDGTNRSIRAKYRNLLVNMDVFDDVIACKCSKYRKMHEYNWIIW